MELASVQNNSTPAPGSLEPEGQAPESDKSVSCVDEPGQSSGSKLPKRRDWLLPLAVFAVSFAVLALTSWDKMLGPSPHFHFVDMAESFLQGRLDTLTPFRAKDTVAFEGDPAGLADAVRRHHALGGLNDWGSYFIVTMLNGEIYKGVWPWSRRDNPRDPSSKLKNRFVLLSGDWMEPEPSKDFKRACVDLPTFRPGTDDRRVWQQRDRIEAERQACEAAAVSGDDGQPRCSFRTQSSVLCQLPKYYISFPPGPAILMLPLVAIWHYEFNDVLFTLFFAALNAMLFFLLLRGFARDGLINRSTSEILSLVLLATFGTVSYFVSVRGEVWFTALVIGLTFNLLYVIAATNLRHPFLAGLALTGAVATRTAVAFAFVYFALQLFLQRKPWDLPGLRLRVRQGLLFAAPLLVGGALLAWFNYARFESFTEFGHRFLAAGTRASIADSGLFSFAFLERNLATALWFNPTDLSKWVTDSFPYFRISGHGLNLWITTPAYILLILFWGSSLGKATRNRYYLSLNAIIWLTLAAIALPGLLYQNTGWLQFGFRFSMDYLPYLILLLAGNRFARGWYFYALIILGVLINLFGAITFNRFPEYYF